MECAGGGLTQFAHLKPVIDDLLLDPVRDEQVPNSTTGLLKHHRNESIGYHREMTAMSAHTIILALERAQHTKSLVFFGVCTY